eukprot:793449-Amorphochlora_amoeboformis.AAC.1
MKSPTEVITSSPAAALALQSLIPPILLNPTTPPLREPMIPTKEGDRRVTAAAEMSPHCASCPVGNRGPFEVVLGGENGSLTLQFGDPIHGYHVKRVEVSPRLISGAISTEIGTTSQKSSIFPPDNRRPMPQAPFTQLGGHLQVPSTPNPSPPGDQPRIPTWDEKRNKSKIFRFRAPALTWGPPAMDSRSEIRSRKRRKV